MPVATLPNRSPAAVALERTAEPASAVSAATFESQLPTNSAGAAQRAVEAVLTAVERFNAGDRHSVSLQFSVGGADLSVRVELHAGEVRTTFRTDSPELRAALATEWSAATPGAADRSMRLAPPVFAASDTAGLTAFSDDATPRERNPRSSDPDEAFSTIVGSRSQATTARAPAPTEFLPRLPVLGAAGTALHLSTLA